MMKIEPSTIVHQPQKYLSQTVGKINILKINAFLLQVQPKVRKM